MSSNLRDRVPRDLRAILAEGTERMTDLMAEYIEAGELDRPFIIGCADWLKEARAALAALPELSEPPAASPNCATCQGTGRVWSGPMKESTVPCRDCRAASSSAPAAPGASEPPAPAGFHTCIYDERNICKDCESILEAKLAAVRAETEAAVLGAAADVKLLKFGGNHDHVVELESHWKDAIRALTSASTRAWQEQREAQVRLEELTSVKIAIANIPINPALRADLVYIKEVYSAIAALRAAIRQPVPTLSEAGAKCYWCEHERRYHDEDGCTIHNNETDFACGCKGFRVAAPEAGAKEGKNERICDSR